MGMEERWAEIQKAIKPFARAYAWSLALRDDEDTVCVFKSALTDRMIALTVDDFRRLVKACTPEIETGMENDAAARMITDELMEARKARRQRLKEKEID